VHSPIDGQSDCHGVWSRLARDVTAAITGGGGFGLAYVPVRAAGNCAPARLRTARKQKPRPNWLRWKQCKILPEAIGEVQEMIESRCRSRAGRQLYGLSIASERQQQSAEKSASASPVGIISAFYSGRSVGSERDDGPWCAATRSV